MKNVRMFFISILINILILFFGSFYFFGGNLKNPVDSDTYLPIKQFPIYELYKNGEVSLNIINIIIYSIIFAIPIFLILKLISRIFTNILLKKGKI
ncbi:hypothetical protein BCV60_20560 [Bacillus halotolerans]|nr:hypothetical protein BCV60_20560 [Bacillus halotolerans]